MAIDYDSNVGYTQATGSNLTKKMWDKVLHEQVQDKSFFKGLIGKDKGGEGSLDANVSNFPIIEKTQLGKDGGDQVTLGLARQMGNSDIFGAGASFAINNGKVANVQLVDNEESLTFSNAQVKIAHLRDGVLIQGKMTEQRSPFDLQKTASSLLSTRLAKHLDDGLFFTMYSGYSPNVVRELGLTAALTTVHPNRIFGDSGGTTYAGLLVADTVDTGFLDRIAVSLSTENVAPCIVDGEEVFLAIFHPYAIKQLRADSLWANAQYYVAEKGKKNPLFSGSIGKWNGMIVRESNKISHAKKFAAADLVVTSNLIATFPDEATTGTTTTFPATDVRMNIVMGANAVARAYGVESYMAKRKEDDYGNLIGFGGGSIYGDRRVDWVPESGTTVNQSSLIAYSYSPAVSGLSIW